ncbi:hypothetical protein V6N13_112342 [Hibiscus sabdariffa]|uniref:Uncharacterized protein n=1 Tax=Hibiscus sabdariffa TaxID=183260 RepID=A0ABR2TMV9_9ROSI
MDMDVGSSFAKSDLGSSQARSAFQWGGTIFALFLLLMNRTGRRSHMQTNLLVLYLFSSFPTVLFKFLRGPFGCWIAFLAIASNLFYPKIFPVSRFILFVVTPDWLADRFRDDIVPGISCLLAYASLQYGTLLLETIEVDLLIRILCAWFEVLYGGYHSFS